MNSSVGEILREARENQGRAIAEVAEELCLTQRYLRAIEDDEVDGLPGTFFYKSFVKQYADYLGVDRTRVQPGLNALMLALGPAQQEAGSQIDPAVESTNRYYIPDRTIGWPVAALAGVLLLCTGFYVWFTRTAPPRATRPAASVASVVAQPFAQPRAARLPARLEDTSNLTTNLPRGTTANLTVADGESTVLLKLSATEATWLSITSGGKEIFSGILQPSESKTVAGMDKATMRIGNAGGVEVQLNGKAIPPLGSRGQVLTVQFTRQDFHIMPEAEEPL